MSGARLIHLSNLQPYRKQSAYAELPNWVAAGDDLTNGEKSTLRLFENDVEIGPPHTPHDLMDADACGGFSHWRTGLYFTASDGTNPVHNGRQYTALGHSEPLSPLAHVLQNAEGPHAPAQGTDAAYRALEAIAHELEPGLRLSERARSYFRDEEFTADYERFEGGNYRSYDRKFMLRELARWAARLSGDMAECGVYHGGSAWLMAKALIAAGREECRLHLFDSFAGLSEPTSQDGSHWRKGDLAAPLELVRANLAEAETLISYWPGWIPSEFHAVADRRFSLVHIDVDLAQPTWDSLVFFYPRLVDHGILVCDDYGFDTCPGAREAMDAYFAERNIPIVHVPTGQGVVLRAPA
jgi:hypothetical protein